MPTWAHGPVYAMVRGGESLVHAAGVDHAMRAMRSAGDAFSKAPFNKKRLQRAIDNIGWCFPDWDEERCRRTAVDAYRHLFCLGAEVIYQPRLMSEDAYADHIEIGNVQETLQILLRGERAISITGHCGNWELLGYTLAVLGFPVHALYRPLDLKPLDAWLRDTRQRRGLTLVDKFGAADLLPPIVERGDPVGFIADQNAGERGMPVPFFDRLASTYKTIGLLALRYEAPIICGMARRVSPMGGAQSGDGLDSQLFKYRLEIMDIIRPDDWVDQPDPLFYVTARYRRAIENMVRSAPEQYLWMHRYWKTRPRHERRGEPFPPRLREKIEQLPWMTPDRVERLVARSEEESAEFAAGTRTR
ncbi:MAG: lysophospholipid acyltransferase family protein [Planctomycetota bacterium]